MLASHALESGPMSLPQLLGREGEAFADTMIKGMQLDSRRVRPGDLFLALPGEQHDGRQINRYLTEPLGFHDDFALADIDDLSPNHGLIHQNNPSWR